MLCCLVVHILQEQCLHAEGSDYRVLCIGVSQLLIHAAVCLAGTGPSPVHRQTERGRSARRGACSGL